MKVNLAVADWIRCPLFRYHLCGREVSWPTTSSARLSRFSQSTPDAIVGGGWGRGGPVKSIASRISSRNGMSSDRKNSGPTPFATWPGIEVASVARKAAPLRGSPDQTCLVGRKDVMARSSLKVDGRSMGVIRYGRKGRAAALIINRTTGAAAVATSSTRTSPEGAKRIAGPASTGGGSFGGPRF